MEKLRFQGKTGPPFADTSELWYQVQGLPVTGELSVRLGIGADGQYVCTGVALDAAGAATTTSDLRKIPLSAIVSDLVTAASKISPGSDIAWVHLDSVELANAGGFAIVDPTVGVDAAAKRGGAGPDQARLELFAATYRAALNGPLRHRPVAATAEQLHISTATAHRYRVRCQSLGLLNKPAEMRAR